MYTNIYLSVVVQTLIRQISDQVSPVSQRIVFCYLCMMYNWSILFLALTVHFCTVVVSPVNYPVHNADNTTVTTKSGWNWKLADLAAEFKDIHWDHVFDENDGECTPEQLDRIIFTARATQ